MIPDETDDGASNMSKEPMQSEFIDVKTRTVRNAINIQFDLICYV